MDGRGRAHQPRGQIDGRRRRDDHSAILQRADRRRAYAHYKKVADAISIPIMVYNNPATANVDMMPELIARLPRSPTAST